MYVLIEEWIPGVPTRLLGSTVEDVANTESHALEVRVSGAVNATNTGWPTITPTMPSRLKHQPRPREPTRRKQWESSSLKRGPRPALSMEGAKGRSAEGMPTDEPAQHLRPFHRRKQ